MKRIIQVIAFILLVLGCQWAAAQDVPANTLGYTRNWKMSVDGSPLHTLSSGDYVLHTDQKVDWGVSYDEALGTLTMICLADKCKEANQVNALIDYALSLHKRIAQLKEQNRRLESALIAQKHPRGKR